MMASVYLPEEIVMDILVRLPMKSLVRFRCVCKSWCSLTSNPDFARKNLNHLHSMEDANDIAILSIHYSTSTATITRIPSHTVSAAVTATLISNDQACGNTKNTSMVYLSVREVDLPVELNPWKFGYTCKGCCDGILCMANIINGRICLWNPSINKYKNLPPSPFDVRYSCIDACGIGYDSSVDDYKVLWVHKENDEMRSPIQVLALKSNSWKTITDQKLSDRLSFSRQDSVFINGGIHLVATTCVDGHQVAVIVCFDVVTEKFGEVPLPIPPDNNGYDDHMNITCVLVFGGKLCFVQRVNLLKVQYVWVMQEYGVRESWVKLINIPWRRGRRPICFSGKGLFLFQEGPITNRFALYNPAYEKFNRFQTTISNEYHRTIVYVENITHRW